MRFKRKTNQALQGLKWDKLDKNQELQNYTEYQRNS
jgi:hypothetical protein